MEHLPLKYYNIVHHYQFFLLVYQLQMELNLSNKSLSYSEESFAMGYYIHRWLDNYFDTNIEKFFLSKYNLRTLDSHVIINENIKNYDIKSIVDFISKITAYLL